MLGNREDTVVVGSEGLLRLVYISNVCPHLFGWEELGLVLRDITVDHDFE